MAGSLVTLLARDQAVDRPIAVSGGETIGLHRFRADVAATAARLSAMGYRRGLVACRDAYWAVVGWFALAQSGGETVLPPNTLPATLASLAEAFDCIVSDGAVQGVDGLVMLQPGAEPAPPLPLIDGERAIISFYTSGSTGRPKRIVKTMRQLDLEAENLDQVLGSAVPADCRVHATVAHHHLYGLTFRVCWPLASGRAFCGEVHEFWEPLMASLAAGDALITSPSHLSRLGGLPPLPTERRPRLIISGGAPLPQEVADSARTVLGSPVRECFGSTETGVVATRLSGDSRPWQPLPGVKVSRLEDGRLHVRSPYVQELDGQTMEDLVEFEADGFRLLGRGDRIAKIEGVRVSLVEFEARLGKLTGVGEAAVVVLGGDNPQIGAVVVLDGVGEDELQARGAFRLSRRLRLDLARTLPSAALPRRWRFVRHLPGGPIGKSSAADLAALFEAT